MTKNNKNEINLIINSNKNDSKSIITYEIKKIIEDLSEDDDKKTLWDG